MSPHAVTLAENLGKESKVFTLSTSVRPGDRIVYLPSDAPTPDELANYTAAGIVTVTLERARRRRDEAYEELRAAHAAYAEAIAAARSAPR